MSRLIDKVVQKITVSYCRLSIVGSQDGFLTQEAVRTLLFREYDIEIVVGSNLQLRIHFELAYKSHPEAKYIYVCESMDTLLDDMRQAAYCCNFSISDVFPLFADKPLLRKQPFDVLDKLYEHVAWKRVTMMESNGVVDAVLQMMEQERKQSAKYMLAQLQSVSIDWNQLEDTMMALSNVICQAIKAGVYDEIEQEINAINQDFQTWIDMHYFAQQNSSALLKAKCVNKVLPYLSSQYKREDKLALIVVDGLAHWQYAILREYLQQHELCPKDDVTLAWLPTITMLSRQAIFRGDYPLQDYKQSPENERKLWEQYWKLENFSPFEIQYLCDKDEFAINEGVNRLAYVTVEMDEKMHSSSDYKDLCSLTENWCPRITEKIKLLLDNGYNICLTTDHGSILSQGWRKLSQVEKVFLYKDGSRGKRHLIYNNKEEQASFLEQNNEQVSLLSHDNWIAIRDNACFENKNQTIITHGGSHFMEVVIPFIKIER